MMASIEKDIAFLDQGLNWPCYPVLPVKKRDGNWNAKDYAGFVWAYLEPEPVIYVGNMYSIDSVKKSIQKETGKEEVTWSQILARFEKKTYKNLTEMMTEYMVD
jgi:hypothetical protein